ncbi:MAG: hypothetical protein WDO16_13515 [Bacteroidota bacterium]
MATAILNLAHTTVTGFTNAAGCDSTATLVLTVNVTTSSTTSVSICSSELPYNWNSTDYTESGTYSITLTNAAGCDSVATLVLTVNTTQLHQQSMQADHHVLPG